MIERAVITARFCLSHLMGSKTPPQNAAKAKELGGGGLPIKVRLVRAD